MNEQELEKKRVTEINRAYVLAEALSKCMNKNSTIALSKALNEIHQQDKEKQNEI